MSGQIYVHIQYNNYIIIYISGVGRCFCMEGLHSIMRALSYHTQCCQLLGGFPQDIMFMHSGIKFGVKIDDFQVACRCIAL